MNIYISFDMEGIGGIDRFSDEFKRTAAYSQAIHAHFKAVIDGIHQSPKNKDIETITVADSHGDGKNLDYLALSEMDERIELISGYPPWRIHDERFGSPRRGDFSRLPRLLRPAPGQYGPLLFHGFSPGEH